MSSCIFGRLPTWYGCTRIGCDNLIKIYRQNMIRKATISSALPLRRGLSENEAAVYLSLSPTFFRRLVDQGVMPRPRIAGGRRIWDVEELDLAFKALPREGAKKGKTFGFHDTDSWADYE